MPALPVDWTVEPLDAAVGERVVSNPYLTDPKIAICAEGIERGACRRPMCLFCQCANSTLILCKNPQ